jgi:hypothetical protein
MNDNYPVSIHDLVDIHPRLLCACYLHVTACRGSGVIAGTRSLVHGGTYLPLWQPGEERGLAYIHRTLQVTLRQDAIFSRMGFRKARQRNIY